MIDQHEVKIVSLFSIYKSVYKYSHRDVLICVNLLAYKGSYKVEVFYDTVQPKDTTANFTAVSTNAIEWIYESIKSSKFSYTHNFIFNLSDEVEIDLRKVLKTQISNTPRVKELGVNIRISPFTDKLAALYLIDIFSFSKLLPFLIPFNFNGSYTLTLNPLGIQKLLDSSLLD